MSTRVLVADAMAEERQNALREAGIELSVQPELKGAALVAAVPGFKVLVVRSTKVTREVLEAADQLALIVRAGSGVNTIDVVGASERGIFVANCPGKNSVAVAELTLGLILALDRRIPDNVSALKEGRWDKKAFAKAPGIKGSVLGLVGFGAIAREVCSRAQAFGMHVQAYSRTLDEDVASAHGVCRAPSLSSLFETSDIVSLHLPATSATKGIVDAALIGSMKPNATLINTSRADVVDEGALIEAVSEGRIRLGTDVYADEPEVKQGEATLELGRLPGVVGTHHIGASPDHRGGGAGVGLRGGGRSPGLRGGRRSAGLRGGGRSPGLRRGGLVGRLRAREERGRHGHDCRCLEDLHLIPPRRGSRSRARRSHG